MHSNNDQDSDYPQQPPPLESNLYQAPQSMVNNSTFANTSEHQFYVVSKTKFIVLTFATLGFYNLYWFWKHWSIWKKYNQSDIWPIPRAIFSIFFTHKLFGIFNDTAIKVSGLQLPALGTQATVFVISTITFRIIDRSSESIPIAFYIVLVIGFLAVDTWALWTAQKQANIACNDDDALSNNEFSAINYVFIVIGAIIWLLMIIGTFFDTFGL